MTGEDDLAMVQRPSLDGVTAKLGPEGPYLAPGGRTAVIAAAMLAGVPVGARVLEIGCGLAAAAIDLAEAFGCRVTAFDSHAPSIARAERAAQVRGVASRLTLRAFDGSEALATFPHDAYDVVLGLGGELNRAMPGNLAGGLAAAARWLSAGGILIGSDLVAVVPPSELLRAVLDEPLPAEHAYSAALNAAGFDLITAWRVTRRDWEAFFTTVDRLRKGTHPHPRLPDPKRQRLLDIAYRQPEIAALIMVARKRG